MIRHPTRTATILISLWRRVRTIHYLCRSFLIPQVQILVRHHRIHCKSMIRCSSNMSEKSTSIWTPLSVETRRQRRMIKTKKTRWNSTQIASTLWINMSEKLTTTTSHRMAHSSQPWRATSVSIRSWKRTIHFQIISTRAQRPAKFQRTTVNLRYQMDSSRVSEIMRKAMPRLKKKYPSKRKLRLCRPKTVKR